MTPNDKARIRELFISHQELSGKQIAKMLSLPMFETLRVLKKLGYSKDYHREAKKAHDFGVKPLKPKQETAPQKDEPKQETAPQKDEPKQETHVYFGTSKIKPEVEERKKQTALNAKANRLLHEADLAASNGDIEKYLSLRKEYEVAARQAEAYKQRGRLNKSEREISGIEQQYQICR